MKKQIIHNWNSIYMELTSQCNLNCIYCYNDSNIMSTQSLPFDLAKQILCQATERNIKNISFSGGEPLLYPYFYELFDFATTVLGRNITLITNASLLTYDFLKRIVSTHTILQLTIDGHTSELHGKTRKTDNFEQNIEVIKHLRSKYKYDGVYVRINVSYHNYKNVFDIVKMLYEMGIKNITVALISTMGRGAKSNKEDNVYQVQLLMELNQTIRFLQQKYIDLRLNYYAFGESLGCDFYSNTEHSINLRIRYDGAIFPCQSFNCQNANLGNAQYINLADDYFEEIFDNWVDKVKKEKEEILQKHCYNCYCRSFCEGGCLAYILDEPSEKTMFHASCLMRRKLYKNKLLSLSTQ